MELELWPTRLAVCRLGPNDPVPAWALAGGGLTSVTRTPDELSIVVAEELVPVGVRSEGPWRALSVAGPLAFSMTGVLASLATPLAAAEVPIFVLSTFDTDWLLLRDEHLQAGVRALEAVGHTAHAR